MGHRKQHAPRRGSLRFLYRVRARQQKGRVRNWKHYSGEPHFLGFAGFKAGMTRIAYEEDNKTNPFFGKELMKAVTVVEVPPLVLFGIKVYEKDDYGLKAVGEVLAKDLNKDLARKIRLPGAEYKSEEKLAELEKVLKNDYEIRGLFHTQPSKASVPRIKPDIIEIPVSGGANAKDRFEYAKSLLGKEIRVRDVMKNGTLIDVIAVTKGKGYQGPVKRFGVRLLTRKNRKGKRRVGSIGPWKPNKTMYTIARAGQMGYHQRVEYHKRIMKISESPEEINPSGGFVNYGLIKNDFVLLLGSVPGPKKRLIRLRKTIRPTNIYLDTEPKITYTSKQSQQA
jgi:large subunit ribosomal protein L3